MLTLRLASRMNAGTPCEINVDGRYWVRWRKPSRAPWSWISRSITLETKTC